MKPFAGGPRQVGNSIQLYPGAMLLLVDLHWAEIVDVAAFWAAHLGVVWDSASFHT